MTLILQNGLIIICAVFFYVFIVYRDDLITIGAWMEYVAYGLIIVVSSAANLAAIANTIAVEKDWIVEIAGRNEERLASKYHDNLMSFVKQNLKKEQLNKKIRKIKTNNFTLSMIFYKCMVYM